MTSPSNTIENNQTGAVPPIVDQDRADMGAPPNGGFQLNVLLRIGDRAYRTYNTQGRGVEQASHTFPLIDLLPYGRQEEWQDSPTGWPQSPTYSGWAPAITVAAISAECGPMMTVVRS